MCSGIVIIIFFSKYSVIGTLTHRAKTFCTTPELPNEELQYFSKALLRCEYHRWAINKIQNKVINGNLDGNGNNSIQVGTSQQHFQQQWSSHNLPQGKTQYGTHIYPLQSGPGGNHQTHVLSMAYKLTSRETVPSSKCLHGPRTRTLKKKEWGNIQLPVWSH